MASRITSESQVDLAVIQVVSQKDTASGYAGLDGAGQIPLARLPDSVVNSSQSPSKEPVRVATESNITLSGLQTIDTVTLAAGERVLVKDQTTGSENGIYVAAVGAWARSTDADTSAEVNPGMLVPVTDGNVNFGSVWSLYSPAVGPITLGTTVISFTKVAAFDVVFPEQSNSFVGTQAFQAGTSEPIVLNPISSDPSFPANGAIWVNSTSNDLKFADGTPTIQTTERVSRKNVASGYAGLDSGSRIAKSQGHSATVYNDQANTYSAGFKQTFTPSATTAGINIVSGADPSALAQGDLFVNTDDLKFRGSAATQTVERQANKNAASGYAGLNASSRIAKAQGHDATVYNDQANVYVAGSRQSFVASATTAGANLASSADPSALAQGDIWVNTSDLKFRGAAATQTVERQANKGAANGYASLDGSTLVPVAQIPPAAVTEVFTWTVSGNIATGTDLDGLRVMPRDGSIVMVTAVIRNRGTSASTIADLNRTVPTKPITTQRTAAAPTGTTVYTTQANRPTLAGGAGGGSETAVIEATDPDVTSFVAGDYFAVDIDAIAGGLAANAPKDLTIQMTVQYS